MRALIQRVSSASVEIDGKLSGKIDQGLVVLLGINENDRIEDVGYLVDKIVHLRIFQDNDGKMNLSVQDVGGGILVISQFTLYANTRKGRRPSFIRAAGPQTAEPLYHQFIKLLKGKNISTASGEFGALMHVHIHNYGPVTILIDSEERHNPRKEVFRSHS